jgi:hypothetical protein
LNNLFNNLGCKRHIVGWHTQLKWTYLLKTQDVHLHAAMYTSMQGHKLGTQCPKVRTSQLDSQTTIDRHVLHGILVHPHNMGVLTTIGAFLPD